MASMIEIVDCSALLIVLSIDALSDSALETAPSAPTCELIEVAIDQ